ncbi:MAG: hypothetical protein CML39_06025 [Rhodobacteraceae bacterium]|nr:MAG: hypothetical protein CML39_06025 [Paracoccaceae bacterium]
MLKSNRRRNLSKEDRVLWNQVKKTFDRTLRQEEKGYFYQKCENNDLGSDIVLRQEKVVVVNDRLDSFKNKNVGLENPPNVFVNHNLDKRKQTLLKKGRIQPEKTLDLHGLNSKQAEKRVIDFLQKSYTNGARLVLIITGKGKRTGKKNAPYYEDSDTGILKKALIPWIENSIMWPKILKIMSAHPKHGGGGAFYVYLRKIK